MFYFSYKEEEGFPSAREGSQHSKQSSVSYIHTRRISFSRKHYLSTQNPEIRLLLSNLPSLLHPRRPSYLSKPYQIRLDRQKPDSCRATPKPNDSKKCIRPRSWPHSHWPSSLHSPLRSTLETRNAAKHVKPTVSSSTRPCLNSSRPSGSVSPRPLNGAMMVVRCRYWTVRVSTGSPISLLGSISWIAASGTISDITITEGKSGAMKTPGGRLTRISRRICRMSVTSMAGGGKFWRRPSATRKLWSISREWGTLERVKGLWSLRRGISSSRRRRSRLYEEGRGREGNGRDVRERGRARKRKWWNRGKERSAFFCFVWFS